MKLSILKGVVALSTNTEGRVLIEGATIEELHKLLTENLGYTKTKDAHGHDCYIDKLSGFKNWIVLCDEWHQSVYVAWGHH